MNIKEPAASLQPDVFVSADHWTSPEGDRAERERLWPKVWQIACREEMLNGPGAFVAYDIMDDPLLIIRTGEGPDDISAIYNVCQHRGRRLVDRPFGRLPNEIACRFHGWRYRFDGSVSFVTNEEDWSACGDLDRAKIAIPRVKIGRWGGWIWINLDPDAEPLEDWLEPLDAALGAFQFEGMRPLWWKVVHAPVNWKVFIEAFAEGYHAGATHLGGVNYRRNRSPSAAHGVHAMFFSESDGLSEYRVREANNWRKPETLQEGLWANNAHLHDTLFALTLAPGMAAADRIRDLPADTPPEDVIGTFYRYNKEEVEKTGAIFPETLTLDAWLQAGTAWHIFPNSVVLPSLDGALWYRVRPDPKNRDACTFDVWSFGRFAPGEEPKVNPEHFEGFEAFRGNCPFLEEDFDNMSAVNEGMKSRAFKGAVLNPIQESTISNFHRALDDFCKER